MKVFFFLLIQLCANLCLYSQSSFTRTKDGIIVFTRTSKAVKLEVVNDHIIRVIAAPGRDFAVSPV